MVKGKKTKGGTARGGGTKNIGKRSGVDLSVVQNVPRDEHGVQHFDAMLAASASAPVVDNMNDSRQNTSAGSILKKNPGRQQEKPKRAIRFSLGSGGDDGGGGWDPAAAAAASATASPRRRAFGGSHPDEKASPDGQQQKSHALKVVRKLVSFQGRGGRNNPLSPSALSEASTAPPSAAMKGAEEEEEDDDDDNEDVGNNNEALNDDEEDDDDVDAEDDHNEDQDAATPPEVDQHDDELDFPPPDDHEPMEDSPPRNYARAGGNVNHDDHIGDHDDDDGDDEDDDDDDLAPPPPPRPDSPGDDDDSDVAAGGGDDRDDFPTGGDDYDDDGDKEGKSYRMAEDEHDDDHDDVSPAAKSRGRRRRHRSKGASDESSSDESDAKPRSAKASRSKKKRKVSRGRSHSDSDSDSDIDEATHHREKASKKSKKKSKRRGEHSDDDSDSSATPRSKTTTKKRPPKAAAKGKRGNPFSPKGVPLPRTYHTIPVTEVKEQNDAKAKPDPKAVRRSTRTRFAPLAWWKGDTVEYGHNDEFDSDTYDDTVKNMPIPVGIRVSEPTPYKKRTQSRPVAAKKKGKKSSGATSESATPSRDDAMVPFDTRRLRKKYKYEDGEVTRVWNDTEAVIDQLKVITYPENLQLRELPTRAHRDPHEGDETGLAAQAFNVLHERPDYPSYLMGSLVLPPRGIKDPESVGRSAQTFTVVTCQPNALEIAYADPDEDEGSFDPETATRFFLCPDAMFRIPPGNCYRLENHSRSFDAKLTWTIIRQNAPEGVVQDTGGNDEDDDDDQEEEEEDDNDDGQAAGRDDDSR